MENRSNILFSIKPKYLKLILEKKKKFEYRTHLWNVKYPYWFTVYESSPVCKIKYKMLLDSPYVPGEKINQDSYGTDRFNNGQMKNKYAYPIVEIEKIENPISLDFMKSIKVFPPQNFLYLNKKPKLYKKINLSNK